MNCGKRNKEIMVATRAMVRNHQKLGIDNMINYPDWSEHYSKTTREGNQIDVNKNTRK